MEVASASIWRIPPLETIRRVPPVCQAVEFEGTDMSAIEQLPTVETVRSRPMRADARRNYEKVLTAARDAFAAGGSAASLGGVGRGGGGGGGKACPQLPHP